MGKLYPIFVPGSGLKILKERRETIIVILKGSKRIDVRLCIEELRNINRQIHIIENLKKV